MATETETNPSAETHSFQAEIKQLLDIVINSLYTDREIFVRELVSNAADALEKFRHETLVNPEIPGKDDELAINITIDKENKTFTISDNGIGMTRDELSNNLGTIARSGTKEFLQAAMQSAQGKDMNLIGQFGVGFYSSFMVAQDVVVETHSFHTEARGWRWESKGDGVYTIGEQPDTSRGTKITLKLKDDADEFADGSKIKNIVRQFSNFVPFPVYVDGEKVNTVQAIWTRMKSEITDEEYTEFYKFIANAYDEPRMKLHFSADAPLAIRALLFVPQHHMEEFGFGRMDPGVDLYCKKVLIQKHPENLLPEWLRFVKGVIDSDDLPLNISRETMQDSRLVKKIGNVVTGRFIKFLEDEAKRDEDAYQKFFKVFGKFIKEGITTDYAHKDGLAKLLRFETSKTEAGKTTSLAEYIDRMKEEQKDIYYISGPSREAIEAGPYVEALRARDFEVIYNFEQIDDFVFDHIGDFQEKKLRSADSGDLDLPEIEKGEGRELTKEEADGLCGWLKEHYGDRIGTVRTSKRLVDNPALIATSGAFSATMQRLMATIQKDSPVAGGSLTLEVNPRHPILLRLYELKEKDADFAKQLADQLCDNAMLAAGLLADPRGMVDRLNKLLAKAAGNPES